MKNAAVPDPGSVAWRLELGKLDAPSTGGGVEARLRRALAMATLPLALLAALLALVIQARRFAGGGPSAAAGDVLAVTHGEWTNRTRHLLALLPDDGSVPVLVVGRPRASLAAFAALLARERPNARVPLLFRALSPAAVLAAAPAVMRAMGEGLRAVARAERVPSATALAAISYRVAAGHVHAAWWRRLGAAPRLAIFGHTGVADTSLLECAMQRSGTATVHLLHGISTGRVFDGISDLLVTRCGHDARWHAQLGGYGRTAAPAAPMPPPVQPVRSEWLLLSNYAHPTGADYLEHGIAAELEVLGWAAAAARMAGARLIYRPHPAGQMLPADERAALGEGVARLNPATWPEDEEYDRIGDFAVVLTTPSTALVDLLRRGRVPLLLTHAPPPVGSIYAEYRWRARDAQEIVQRADALAAVGPDSLADAWTTIAPAAPFVSWQDLVVFCDERLQRG